MTMKTRRATLDDLYRVPEGGKAELINGEVVAMAPTGFLPGYAGGEIFVSLRNHVKRTQAGVATPDNVGYVVNLPHRDSFSPDAAYHTGRPTGMRFLQGAPAFAAEVRSENDYGPDAERAMADKRADYFAAGTRVVWDVDMLGAEVVRAYRAEVPDGPTVYRRGQVADAEPAVPGWVMAVDDLFP